jgi:hypothetical protein
MTDKHSKLRHQQQEEQTADLQQTSKTQVTHTFESVEEVLQQDTAMTEVPPAVEERLSKSVAEHPRKPGSWWNRWRKSG